MVPRTYLALVLAALALATIDVTDTWLAKLWVLDRTRWWVFVAGAATSFSMFVIFALMLTVADIWLITVMWAVATIVGGYAIDRLVYGVVLPADVMIVLIHVVVGVGYLTYRSTTGGST